jgi:hypothetical protein
MRSRPVFTISPSIWNSSVFVAIAGLMTTACGPQCQTLQAEHAAFMTQAVEGKPTTKGAHLRLAMPTRALTRSVDAALGKMKTAQFDLPGLGDLGRYLPAKLSVAPRKIKLALEKDDAAKIDLDFDVKQGGKALFGMELVAAAPITYTPEKGKMRFSIRADMFEKVKPRIDENAVAKLTDGFLNELPGAVRMLVPRSEVTRLARKAVEYLGEKAYDLLRTQVLADVGELTSFSIDFPDVPLAGMSLTSIGGADGFLRLDTRFDLPVTDALPDEDADLNRAMNAITQGKRPDGADEVEVAVSTQAVMALANWGLAKGKLPTHYSDAGEPSPTGKYQIGAAWEPGERPLKVNLWSLATPGMCLHALAGAQPAVEWEKGKLTVGVTQSRIEKLSGPPLLQLALQLTNISEGLFDFTQSIATRTEIGVGGETWRLGLDNVRLDGRIFRLRFKTGAQKKGA